MSKIKIFQLACAVFCGLLFYSGAILNLDNEEYRALVYPPFTVLQFAVGLAVPAQVPNRSVFTNLGTISNIPLPNSITDLYPYISASRYLTHNYLYNLLAGIFTSYHLDGKECVKKTICQMSRAHIDNDDVTHLILEYLFIPSSVKNIIADKEYLLAEEISRHTSMTCAETFPTCQYSLLDIIGEGPV